MITEQHIQEGLSRSYIQAVAGIAGVNLLADREFDYGFDGTFRKVSFRGDRRVENSFPLDFQLKCTKNWQLDGGCIVYDLESKTYNDLVTRHPSGTGAILIVLCLPESSSDWVEVSEDYLKVQKCCYYTRLSGDPVKNEKSSKRIWIPRENILTGRAVQAVLDDERHRRTGVNP
ncbi:MAG: DUF4365 domain-containing protein [Alphaproteobacteria bacterium]|nr:DUF4365 domain-containing protein [Alphaproteobacteria bacterium]MBU1280732.1 DUF4365 domain-containing protein [Alphaproteobacteria bacterium]MBU1573341.1 DUF4365 domain-containing protein [Alphaproteobacteria bacterium]MBU1828482.1 DUF4365 domain-containing protein [Alphaproteobacteria bacterium]MBU2077313.1 DUF4365 domain-containing protein [Alphaproteobacteria bacterium]